MKAKKIISLSFLTLAICSVAVATEYKAPDVGFKSHLIKKAEMKSAEMENYYHYQGPAKTAERQIASEEEVVKPDRDPSSIVAKPDRKPAPEKVEPKDEVPQPWKRSHTFREYDQR